MQELRMQPDNQRKIAMGRKTRTCRSKAISGHFIMGPHIVAVALPGSFILPIHWPSLSSAQQFIVAWLEGFDTVEEFENTVKRLRGSRFIRGETTYFMHPIKMVLEG